MISHALLHKDLAQVLWCFVCWCFDRVRVFSCEGVFVLVFWCLCVLACLVVCWFFGDVLLILLAATGVLGGSTFCQKSSTSSELFRDLQRAQGASPQRAAEIFDTSSLTGSQSQVALKKGFLTCAL